VLTPYRRFETIGSVSRVKNPKRDGYVVPKRR